MSLKGWMPDGVTPFLPDWELPDWWGDTKNDDDAGQPVHDFDGVAYGSSGVKNGVGLLTAAAVPVLVIVGLWWAWRRWG